MSEGDDSFGEADLAIDEYLTRVEEKGDRYLFEIRQGIAQEYSNHLRELQEFWKSEDLLQRSDHRFSSGKEGGGAIRNVGGYVLEQLLGSGGMGAVYLARQAATNRLVALKILAGRHGKEATVRFKREVLLTSALRHPNVIVVHDAGEEAGELYYSMEYCEGGSLQDAIEAAGEERLDPKRVAHWFKGLADGLDHAHSKGVFHRDIKPANILFTHDGGPVLADFGLAHASSIETKTVTRTDQTLGTWDYMSPEQTLGAREAARAESDIYSLGVTLYVALTGKLPIPGDSEFERLANIATVPATDLQKYRKDVPAVLSAICMHCLHKRPEDRYQSAADLSADASLFLAGFPPRYAKKIRLTERLRLLAKRSPIATLLSSLLLAVLTVIAIVFPWLYFLVESARDSEVEALREADRAAREIIRAEYEAETAIKSLSLIIPLNDLNESDEFQPIPFSIAELESGAGSGEIEYIEQSSDRLDHAIESDSFGVRVSFPGPPIENTRKMPITEANDSLSTYVCRYILPSKRYDYKLTASKTSFEYKTEEYNNTVLETIGDKGGYESVLVKYYVVRGRLTLLVESQSIVRGGEYALYTECDGIKYGWVMRCSKCGRASKDAFNRFDSSVFLREGGEWVESPLASGQARATLKKRSAHDWLFTDHLHGARIDVHCPMAPFSRADVSEYSGWHAVTDESNLVVCLGNDVTNDGSFYDFLMQEVKAVKKGWEQEESWESDETGMNSRWESYVRSDSEGVGRLYFMRGRSEGKTCFLIGEAFEADTESDRDLIRCLKSFRYVGQ